MVIFCFSTNDIIDNIRKSLRYRWFMLLGHVTFDLAHGQDVSSACRLHCINWLQRVRYSVCFEFVCLRWINVLNVDLIVSNISHHVLFQLLWLCFFDVAQVHIVAALNQFLLSISVRNSSFDVCHVELIVMEELFGLSSFRYLRLQQVRERIGNESVASRRHVGTQ